MKMTDEEIAKATALKDKLKSQGVKYCVGAYVDIHGVPKGKFVPIDHFAHFAGGSELYTGYVQKCDDQETGIEDLREEIAELLEQEQQAQAALDAFIASLELE